MSASAVQTVAPFDLGDEVGEFRILKVLHASQRSVVALGEHRRLGFPAAIKFFHNDGSFERERGALNTLSNIYTPGLLDAGWFERDQFAYYLVMELIEGDTLQRLLNVERRLLGEDAMRLAVHLLRALQYAHTAGLVHGDVKPENIIVAGLGTTAERFALVDYGEVQSMRAPLAEQSGTRTLATPEYAAPEVLRGIRPGVAADVYSVGAVIYQCITGKRPSQCAIDGAIPPIGEVVPVGAVLSDVIARAMAELPEHRYPTAREFASRLEALAVEETRTVAAISGMVPAQREALDTVEVGDAPAADGTAVTTRPTHDGNTPLLSTGAAEIWAFTGDPGVDQDVVRDALNQLDSEFRIKFFDASEREEARIEYVGGTPPPAVIVFGDLHALLGEPLLVEVGRQNETSMLLVSTHENGELLDTTVNACGLHGQVCLPKRPEEIADSIRTMATRSQRLRRRYDGLRLALRDAREDLAQLRKDFQERG